MLSDSFADAAAELVSEIQHYENDYDPFTIQRARYLALGLELFRHELDATGARDLSRVPPFPDFLPSFPPSEESEDADLKGPIIIEVTNPDYEPRGG